MWTRKALDQATDHAADRLTAVARAHAISVGDAIDPLREDVALAALVIGASLVVLGLCVVAAAVVVADGR